MKLLSRIQLLLDCEPQAARRQLIRNCVSRCAEHGAESRGTGYGEGSQRKVSGDIKAENPNGAKAQHIAPLVDVTLRLNGKPVAEGKWAGTGTPEARTDDPSWYPIVGMSRFGQGGE